MSPKNPIVINHDDETTTTTSNINIANCNLVMNHNDDDDDSNDSNDNMNSNIVDLDDEEILFFFDCEDDDDNVNSNTNVDQNHDTTSATTPRATATTTASNDNNNTANGDIDSASSEQQETKPVFSYSELQYGFNSYYAIIQPVFITMVLSALAVVYISTPEYNQMYEEALSRTYTVLPTSSYDNDDGETDTNGLKIIKSLFNAFIMVLVICVATFLIVLLYKYKCMKVIITYMVLSNIVLLGVLSASMIQVAMERYQIYYIDKISFYAFLYNLSVVGVISIFCNYASDQQIIPMYVTQFYLIIISVIIAWQLSHFDEWTAWSLLIFLALYDLFAVLSPCGPLKALVNLMSKDDAPALPGLLYEANVTPTTTTNRNATTANTNNDGTRNSNNNNNSTRNTGDDDSSNNNDISVHREDQNPIQQQHAQHQQRDNGHRNDHHENGVTQLQNNENDDSSKDNNTEEYEIMFNNSDTLLSAMTSETKLDDTAATLTTSLPVNIVDGSPQAVSPISITKITSGSVVSRQIDENNDDENEEASNSSNNKNPSVLESSALSSSPPTTTTTTNDLPSRVVDLTVHPIVPSLFRTAAIPFALAKLYRLPTVHYPQPPWITTTQQQQHRHGETNASSSNPYANDDAVAITDSNENSNNNNTSENSASNNNTAGDNGNNQNTNNSVTSPDTATLYSTEQLISIIDVVFPLNGGCIRMAPATVQLDREEIRYQVVDREGIVKRTLFVNKENGKIFEDLNATPDGRRLPAERQPTPVGERTSIRLGLGDFIFYSVLVSKAALYSYATFISSTVAIVTGLGLTLLLLSISGKALPALPISIALGVLFFLQTRYVTEPWLQQILFENQQATMYV